jgi:hypothetical protein
MGLKLTDTKKPKSGVILLTYTINNDITTH